VVKGKYPKVHEKDGNYFVGIGLVTDLVTDIRHKAENSPLISSSIYSREINSKNPSQPVNPSLFEKSNIPKRLETLDPCPTCGSENIGVWPDESTGYYCLDCYPNFSDEPNF
jgi:hypothetical protein